MSIDRSNKKPNKETGTYRLRPSMVPLSIAAAESTEEEAAQEEASPPLPMELPNFPTGRITETRKLKRIR